MLITLLHAPTVYCCLTAAAAVCLSSMYAPAAALIYDHIEHFRRYTATACTTIVLMMVQEYCTVCTPCVLYCAILCYTVSLLLGVVGRLLPLPSAANRPCAKQPALHHRSRRQLSAVCYVFIISLSETLLTRYSSIIDRLTARVGDSGRTHSAMAE